jgi:hypothetical protein
VDFVDNKMQIVFIGDPYPQEVEKVVFLVDSASHQDMRGNSCQVDAIQLLEQLGYDGIVYVPEEKKGSSNTTPLDDEARIRWVHGALMRSDVAVFLFSEEVELILNMPMGIELGWLMESGRLVLGLPLETEKFLALRVYAKISHIPCYETVRETLFAAITMIGAGAKRQDAETAIPLMIWKTASFQDWLMEQKKVGNRLEDAYVEWIGRVGPGKDIVFFWIVYVKVWIQDEGRYKENEWVIGRPNISSVLLYLPHPTDPLETKIVLVKEYRSPVSNSPAKIYELPGGSTFKPEVDPYVLAKQELQEETGFTLNVDRQLRYHIPRQLTGTLSMHKCHLFSLALTPEEMSSIEANVGKTFGISADTEQTSLAIMSLSTTVVIEREVW